MRIVFLPSSARDLQWFRLYYMAVFPDGAKRARKQFRAILEILKANPFIGHISDMDENARELPIPRTPFVLIYRPRQDRLEILRIVDARSGWKN